MAKVITLTTDFGTADWFVGSMKGVIATIAPNTRVIDLTHGVPPGDIRTGAFSLRASCRFFPQGTIHVAVVDPGVGSSRKPIAVQTENFCFIAPDNGLLTLALAEERIRSIRVLENEKYFLHPVSRTFHGRDIFSPVAAHLSLGVPFRSLGPVLGTYAKLNLTQPKVNKDQVLGEVSYIDRFGNAITNLDATHLQGFGQAPIFLYTGRKRLCPVKDFYQEVPPGKPVAVIGSAGFLEIALNGGNAAEKLNLVIGDQVLAKLR